MDGRLARLVRPAPRAAGVARRRLNFAAGQFAGFSLVFGGGFGQDVACDGLTRIDVPIEDQLGEIAGDPAHASVQVRTFDDISGFFDFAAVAGRAVLRGHSAPNPFGPPPPDPDSTIAIGSYGDSTQRGTIRCVQLAPGQALELELDPPECRYWSVHLNNWWLESPEFRDGQSVCINDAQAERNDDGTITMLVGPDDPGGGNWLDTKGRTETILLARYLLPEDELPPIVARVVEI